MLWYKESQFSWPVKMVVRRQNGLMFQKELVQFMECPECELLSFLHASWLILNSLFWQFSFHFFINTSLHFHLVPFSQLALLSLFYASSCISLVFFLTMKYHLHLKTVNIIFKFTLRKKSHIIAWLTLCIYFNL